MLGVGSYNTENVGLHFDFDSSRFIFRTTAATRPVPIERASKTDILTILAVYQQ